MCKNGRGIEGESRGATRYDACVRWTLAGLVLIAACYTPEIGPGVSCSTDMVCPKGQSCDGDGVCRVPGGNPDAAIDAPSDRDGDGILDMSDNCPDDPNLDQANEDGDKFGDVCDPCPGFPDDAPGDFDHDGVADACDPNPAMAGDHIELFEGFHHGLPAWTRTGAWTAADDSLRIESTGTSDYVVVPVSPPDHVTVLASVIIKSVTATPVQFLEVSLPNNAAANLGIGCEMSQLDAAGQQRYLSLWNGLVAPPPGNEIGNAALLWKPESPYVLSLKRVDKTYDCRALDVTASTTAETSRTSDSGSTVAEPTAVIRAHSVSAVVQWVMVVRSP